MATKQNVNRFLDFLSSSRFFWGTVIVAGIPVTILLVGLLGGKIPARYLGENFASNIVASFGISTMFLAIGSILLVGIVVNIVMFWNGYLESGVAVSLKPQHEAHPEHEVGEAVFLGAEEGVAQNAVVGVSIHGQMGGRTLEIDVPNPLTVRPGSNMDSFDFDSEKDRITINSNPDSSLTIRLKLNIEGQFRGQTREEITLRFGSSNKIAASEYVNIYQEINPS